MTGTGFSLGAGNAPRPIELDASQAAVLGLADGRSAAVFGAPGSGKTSTIVEFVADRVARGASPEELLVLAPSRLAASRLRDVLALRIDRPTDGPLARTSSSLAFELVGAAARAAGAPVPRLLTGADQDADLAALLAGDVESGTGPDWPDPLDAEVRGLRGFRDELREFMNRVTEYDLRGIELRDWAVRYDHPEWAAAAAFIHEYRRVIASARANQYDSAEFARFAVAAIARRSADDRVARLRWVLVDDIQEATQATMAILKALAARGVAIVAFGDPDVASNAFRGGEPDALGRLGERLDLDLVERFVLTGVHRGSSALRGLLERTVGKIGTAAAGEQRRARPVGPDPAPDSDRPPLVGILEPSQSRQAAAIARLLREENLRHGVPWSELAVVVRNGSAVPELARALARAEVPTRTSSSSIPLREDPTARALLRVVEIGIGRRELDPELAEELLRGPFGGLDPLGLRSLRLSLREEELAGGGTRAAGALLVDALGGPERLATLDTRAAKPARRLARVLSALRAASDATIEDLLWIAWDGSGRAPAWLQTALGTGLAAAEADRDLDGIVAVFAAAKRFVEQRPDARPDAFLSQVLDADVAEDLIAPRRSDDAVLVGTPSSMVGLEFRTVVVASVQDGVWPNLRPRGSLLAPQQLVRIAEGRHGVIDERKTVLDDELRLFALAVSRASERVVLAAVSSDDEKESVLFSVLGVDPPPSTVEPPLTLRGMVGRLRRILVESGSDADRRAAARTIALLAADGVAGADPDSWFGIRASSSAAPLYADVEVPVSPSQIEKIRESPMDWAVDKLAGSTSSTAMSIGTLLHWAMETASAPDVDSLWAAVESRWPELGFESPWLSAYQQTMTRRLVEALSEYLRDFAAAGKTLVGAESRFSFMIGRAKVTGSIDRVEVDPDGAVVIVDLKTGSPITSQAVIDVFPQLSAYQLAYREGELDDALAVRPGHHGGGAKLVFVKSGVHGKSYREGIQLMLDKEGLDAFRELILEAADLISAASFIGPAEPKAFGRRPDPAQSLIRVPEVSHD